MKILITVFFLFCGVLFGGWAEDVLEEMSLEEKIGQLFIVPACPKRGEEHREDLERLMRECHVGGVIMKQAHPHEQVSFLNWIQTVSKYPLLCTADAEWGLGMRMDETLSFPRNLTLGAVQDQNLLFELGKMIGKQCHAVGVHLNFAPVIDVNNNPHNPVIHTRSFGEDPIQVASRGKAVLLGMQEGGILACVKHFPGHGDVTVDSHHALPVIPHSKEHLAAIELLPFREAIRVGVAAVMTAHLSLSAYDPYLPTSLSSEVVEGILRDEWGFEGLIITDALNMKALTNDFPPESIALLAHAAGNDLLLYGTHKPDHVDALLRDMVPRAYAALKQAYIEGEFTEEKLNRHVLRILKAKERAHHKPTLTSIDELHSADALALRQKLFQEAVSLYHDEGNLPLKQPVAYFQFGHKVLTPFYLRLQEKLGIDPHAETAVIAIYGMHEEMIEAIEKVRADYPRSILVLFASPYALAHFEKKGTMLVAYQNDPAASKAAAAILLGETQATGKLPITP